MHIVKKLIFTAEQPFYFSVSFSSFLCVCTGFKMFELSAADKKFDQCWACRKALKHRVALLRIVTQPCFMQGRRDAAGLEDFEGQARLAFPAFVRRHLLVTKIVFFQIFHVSF